MLLVEEVTHSVRSFYVDFALFLKDMSSEAMDPHRWDFPWKNIYAIIQAMALTPVFLGIIWICR